MPREYICQYGDCDETKTPIKVSHGDERPRFCCEEHAAAWLIQRAIRTSPSAWADERARQIEHEIADAIKYVRGTQWAREYGEPVAIAKAEGN